MNVVYYVKSNTLENFQCNFVVVVLEHNGFLVQLCVSFECCNDTADKATIKYDHNLYIHGFKS